MAALLSIGELAKRAGVATSTLRYYDDLGLVAPTARESGRRRYEPGLVQRVQVIRLCQRAGLSLQEIGALLEGQTDVPSLAAAKLYELDARIGELQQARALVAAALACGCLHLESCGRAAHAVRGNPAAREEGASDAGPGGGAVPSGSDRDEGWNRHEARHRDLA